MKKLIFNKANAKLVKLEKKTGKKVYSISSLSGIFCPYAKDCFSMAKPTKDGLRIQDGKDTRWRCYSASAEVAYPSVYKSRKYNSDLINKFKNDVKKLTKLISVSLPEKAEIVRLHVGGDFRSQEMFDSYLEVAKLHPDKTFYAYTKSLPFWVKRINIIPKNFKLTASYGGRRDDLIEKFKLKYAKVVFSEKEANQLKLEIDWDDTHALGNKSFALLIHNVQPKGSEASKALWKIRNKEKKTSLAI